VPDPFDQNVLIDQLEVYLLGEAPTLSGNDLADEVGIPFEVARQRWRSLAEPCPSGRGRRCLLGASHPCLVLTF